MSDGFQVNIGALQEASDGVSAILLYLRYEKVSDIGGNGQGYGNDSLASAVSDFCNRWEIGVENLAKDTQEIASRLSLSAQAYAKVDGALADYINETLRRSSGADPAVNQW